MKPRFTTLVLSLLFLILPALAAAQEKHGKDCASCHTLSVKEASELLAKTGLTVKSVKQSPMRGMFEVMVEQSGKQGFVNIDYSKKHLVPTLPVSLENLQPVSTHEIPKPKEPDPIDIKTIPAENAFIIGNPKGGKKLFIFTDPDCPYCRKFHVELKKLVKIAPDVAVHIMLYPLQMHPQAYDKARTVLETMSTEILDNAFEGKEVPKPTKDASKAKVDAIIKFAEKHSINGTPTMILPDGKVKVGGSDAEALKKLLEGK